MNLESWLYRRSREEYVLSLLSSAHDRVVVLLEIVRHQSRQEEAEQEIERILRA